ncbi:MAG: hypothetical protein M3Y81_20700 [Chloroflexota bacterium]|nr:hypothetical protein [Chloroflexota bacterium]
MPGIPTGDAIASQLHRTSFSLVVSLSTGAAIVLWSVMSFRQENSIRQVLRYPPLLLALIGDVVTLASAPIDNAWHTAFGRDAFLWSPPHLLGIVGLLAVGSGILLAAGQQLGRRGYLVTSAVGALVLCVSLVPVMEYESDVPQFASIWYLPVLTVCSRWHPQISIAYDRYHRSGNKASFVLESSLPRDQPGCP